MGTVYETAVSVRFGGVDLDPDEITRLLGVEPEAAHRYGDPMPNGRGTWRRGLWVRRVPRSSPGDIETQVRSLFARMSSDLIVWQDLSLRYHGDIFCGLFLEDSNEGISISPDCIRAIADRGLQLGFDIYYRGD